MSLACSSPLVVWWAKQGMWEMFWLTNFPRQRWPRPSCTTAVLITTLAQSSYSKNTTTSSRLLGDEVDKKRCVQLVYRAATMLTSFSMRRKELFISISFIKIIFFFFFFFQFVDFPQMGQPNRVNLQRTSRLDPNLFVCRNMPRSKKWMNLTYLLIVLCMQFWF